MSLETVKKDIQNNQIPPIYLWYGEDRYSLTEALKALKAVFLAEDPSGSGIESFSGKESATEEVTESANTSSFFSRRLVIVDDIPYFSQGKGKAEGQEDDGARAETDPAGEAEGSNTDRLLVYCQNPNPATCLVLISEKVNRGRKLYKAISKAGKIIEFAYPKGQAEWLAWIVGETRARDKKIKSSTASYLLDRVGHHTGILSQELDKLCLYTGKKEDISEADIDVVCISLIETTVFAMLDAIAAGNSREAIQKLSDVLSREYFLKIHTMIVRQIRLLLAASVLRKRGGTVERFMEVTGVRSPYEGNKIFRQAAGFTPEKLYRAMEECLQTELALKSSGGNPHLLLEMMIIRFCRSK